MKTSLLIATLITALFTMASAFAEEDHSTERKAAGAAVMGIGATDMFVHGRDRVTILGNFNDVSSNAEAALDDLLTVRDRQLRKLAPQLTTELDKVQYEILTGRDKNPGSVAALEIRKDEIKKTLDQIAKDSHEIAEYDKRIANQRGYIFEEASTLRVSKNRYVYPEKFQRPLTKANLKIMRGGAILVGGSALVGAGYLGSDERMEERNAELPADEPKAKDSVSAELGD